MDVSSYHLPIEGTKNAVQLDDSAIQRVYDQVFRTELSQPGFSLLSFEPEISSKNLRSLMWSLKNSLSTLNFQQAGKHLIYLSMGRFDSQVTTKFHLDGAPDEAFLMLGYEVSSVESSLAVADYSRAAQEWRITPKKLLSDFNPMFAENERRLMPYVTPIAAFSSTRAHILLLNNSSLPYVEGSRNRLGVMHQATIVSDTKNRRIINSTMISTATNREEESITAEVQKQFLETSEIAGALGVTR